MAYQSVQGEGGGWGARNDTEFKKRLHTVLLLSTIGRLLLPALDFGTVYLLTSGLSRHSQHFVKS